MLAFCQDRHKILSCRLDTIVQWAPTSCHWWISPGKSTTSPEDYSAAANSSGALSSSPSTFVPTLLFSVNVTSQPTLTDNQNDDFVLLPSEIQQEQRESLTLAGFFKHCKAAAMFRIEQWVRGIPLNIGPHSRTVLKGALCNFFSQNNFNYAGW